MFAAGADWKFGRDPSSRAGEDRSVGCPGAGRGPDYFFATTIVLIVAVTFSTTSTTTM
jgi:hypothetical protein